MQVVFENRDLRTLYQTGSCRKPKLPKEVAYEFAVTVRILEAAKDIYDLWQEPSLHFEKLKGSASRYSVRLTRKWRLEMEIEWKNEDKTIGVLSLVEISAHYGG